MNAWFFWLALLLLLPSVYITLRFIVWISEKLERKK
tara:strand:- start:358 stop:465 length:108 start_codon:yes stop_codon:yes gene_type:complete